MWRERHLRGIPEAQKDMDGIEVVEIGVNRRGIIEELEIAHVYIEQLNEKINQQQKMIDELTERIIALVSK